MLDDGHNNTTELIERCGLGMHASDWLHLWTFNSPSAHHIVKTPEETKEILLPYAGQSLS